MYVIPHVLEFDNFTGSGKGPLARGASGCQPSTVRHFERVSSPLILVTVCTQLFPFVLSMMEKYLCLSLIDLFEGIIFQEALSLSLP